MNKPTPGHDDPSSAISRLAVSPARTFLFTEEREAAARVFVKKNVPELDAVLDQLKLSKPDEYQKVIYDLFHTSERFAVMRQEDQGRSELALKSWQVEAKTQVLAARLVAHPDQGERLMAELHKAVEVLADLQVEQAAYEVRRLEDKVRRAEGQRKIIASRRNEFVNQRLEAILQAVGRAEAGQKESSQPNR